jgi:acyl carrier protein
MTTQTTLPPELAAKSALVVPQLIKLLEDFTQDWDKEENVSMGRNTRLLDDLGFESIDIVQLVVAIEEEVTKKKIPFDKLLMQNGRYVDDLTIGQISDFIAVFV